MGDRRKNYRAWGADQSSQEPVSPRDALPENGLVFFLLDLVPQLDLSSFHDHYGQELRGQPPFDVTMMVTLLVYGYSIGVCSSRKIAAACERNLAFRAIVGNDPPDFRTISDFRKIHRAAFRPLFLEVLRLAGGGRPNTTVVSGTAIWRLPEPLLTFRRSDGLLKSPRTP